MSRSLLALITFTILGTLGAVAAPTIYRVGFSQQACRQTYGIRTTFDWQAEKVSPDQKVFVHIVDANNKVAWTADHSTPTPTSTWSGRVQYEILLNVPATIPDGWYTMCVGMYNPSSGARLPLTAGPGVLTPQKNYYQVGSLQVSSTAPLPSVGPATLDLSDYRLTFNEDFTKTLSVSPRGPDTRWAAHMPDIGDFSDAKFMDPAGTFPFQLVDGMLRIQSKKVNGAWQSGLLSSWNAYGKGFAQKFGYFEIQAKIPKGEALWPTFWLMKTPTSNDANITRVEIDVLENFGTKANTLYANVHFWGPGSAHHNVMRAISVAGMGDDFHRYGVMIEADYTTFYFDGAPYWQMVTPPEAKVPLYLIVNLAIGGGYASTNTPNPSALLVDFIRVYAKK